MEGRNVGRNCSCGQLIDIWMERRLESRTTIGRTDGWRIDRWKDGRTKIVMNGSKVSIET